MGLIYPSRAITFSFVLLGEVTTDEHHVIFAKCILKFFLSGLTLLDQYVGYNHL